MMEGFVSYIEDLKIQSQASRAIETAFLENPNANNSYNKSILSSIYTLNAYKSSINI